MVAITTSSNVFEASNNNPKFVYVWIAMNVNNAIK